MSVEEAGLKLIADGVAGYLSDMKKADKATTGFYSTLGDGGKHASAFQQVITGALRQVGVALVQFGIQGAKAIGGFVKDSIGLAGDFEANMLQFQSVAGKSVNTSGLEDFRDLFLDIGKRLPVSTSEVQQAAIEMVKGGIDPATIAAGGLEQNIQFAAAAMGGDLVKAAEISSKILGGWAGVNATAAEKADFLTHATDLLTKAANASSTDVEGLSRGIFNAQGIARTAGVKFDDLTTTLAELAPRFASSSEAGNSLKNMIVRLQPTTDPATQAMTALGLYTEKAGSAFYDAQGNFVGFQKASQLLQDSLKGLTKEQQAAVLQTIFGNDAMGSAAALAELGSQGYQNMAAALENANGVAAAAALKQQGFNTALDNAKGSAEALQITIGTFLLPILTDLMNNVIAPGVNAITDFATAFMKMVPAIAASDDPFQTFLNALKIAAPGMLDLITQIEDAKDSFVAFITPIAAVVIPAMERLGSFIGQNLNPILIGLAAVVASAVVPAMLAATAAFIAAAAPVVAIGVAVALLAKAWETDFGGIRTTVTAVWEDTVLPALKEMQAWLAEKVPPAIKTLSDVWENTLLPALSDAWAFIDKNVLPILKSLSEVYIAAAIIEVKALAAIWTGTLQPALAAVWSFISGSVIPIFKALFEVNWAIATKAVEAMAGLWQKVLQPAFAAVGTYINDTVVPAFKSIGDYLTATFGPILADAKKWLDDVTGGFGGVSGAVDFVVGKLHEFADLTSNLKLPDWLTPHSPTDLEVALFGIGTALNKSVGPGLATMRQGMQAIGTEITDTFANTDMIDALKGIGEDVMAGFGQGLKDGVRGVVRYIDSAANTVEGAFCDAFQTCSPSRMTMPIGENVMAGLMVGMAAMLPALNDLADQTATAMKLALTKNIKDGQTEIDKQLDALLADIKSVASDIQSAIADVFGATASVDRQLSKNLDDLQKIDPALRAMAEYRLRAAQQEAQSIADPVESAKLFQLRSKQIMEMANLETRLAQAQRAANETTGPQSDEMAKSDENRALIAVDLTNEQRSALEAQLKITTDLVEADAIRARIAADLTDAQRATIDEQLIASQTAQDAQIVARQSAMAQIELLQQQIALIGAAQGMESQQFAANAAAQASPLKTIMDQVVDLFHGTDIKDKIPGLAENPIVGQLFSLLDKLRTAQSSPAVVGGPSWQQVSNQTTNFSMPIYTNMSPTAIQDSLAISGAALL